MNETLKTIAERYTCRAFTDTPLKKEDLEAIVLAGAQAPTAANSQRFRIIVINDKEHLDSLNAKLVAMMEETNPMMTERIKERGGKALYNCAAMIVLAIEPVGAWSAELDGGIVIENMALAAHSLGIGNCIHAMCRLLFEGDEGKAFMQELQFPEGYVFGCGLLLGYAAETKSPHEPALDKIIWV